MSNKLTAISLFSGMGGDTLGMKNAGIIVKAFSEKIDIIRQTHLKNFPNCNILGSDVSSDITKITDDEFRSYENNIDIVFAGFPCQGFSNAGKKKLNDPRNTLFREFVRATKLIQPKIIIGENVKGLLSRKTTNGDKYIDIIQQEFIKLGYSIIYKVFKCYKYGIPQKRERLIILGIKKELVNTYNLSFPNEDDRVPNLMDIVKFNMTGAIKIEKITPDDIPFDMTSIPDECILTDMSNTETENNPHPYLKLKALARNVIYKDKTHPTLLSFSKRGSPIHSEIIDIRKPSKTIICTYNHQPRLLVPLKNKNGYFIRCLLPNELKQIQGFPVNYNIIGNNKQKIIQIGNAVPPPLIEQIMKHILGCV